ncbi:MAG TPA: hypothetical protein VKF82_02755 [Candidatus Eremiobacteraceae bacterium]|nr:hypothetical protein [Candidatus Eremiobacteraceae bacterium]
MERKHFLAAAGIAGAALTVAGIAAADTSSNTPSGGCAPMAPKPLPSGASPRPHVPHQRASEIDSAYKHVVRLVDMLSKDPNDYDGHRVKALEFLTNAESELQQAVAYEQAHPTATSSPL